MFWPKKPDDGFVVSPGMRVGLDQGFQLVPATVTRRWPFDGQWVDGEPHWYVLVDGAPELDIEAVEIIVPESLIWRLPDPSLEGLMNRWQIAPPPKLPKRRRSRKKSPA
jgi:hypothetical protein